MHKLIKCDRKDIWVSISNKCCSLKLPIYQRILKKIIMVSTKILIILINKKINIGNNKFFLSSKPAY